MAISKSYLSLRIVKKALQMGDCPNVEIKTLGGEKWWHTIYERDEWKVQQHRITRHCRILDPKQVRKAWGLREAMLEKVRRLTRPEFLEPGDVVGVSRKRRWNIYDHYAVYIGEGKVIHYAAPTGDFGREDISIHEASINTFLDGDMQYFVLYFTEDKKEPIKIQASTSFRLSDKMLSNTLTFGSGKGFHLYSPEETILRARLRMGEKEYNLINNNCEHFAIWCKTGVEESDQVRQIIERAVQIAMDIIILRF